MSKIKVKTSEHFCPKKIKKASSKISIKCLLFKKKVSYKIQETTHGSGNPIYGTYIGYFHKYTPKELKHTSIANGTQTFKLRPITYKVHKTN